MQVSFRPQFALVDLDGTITDPARGIISAFRHALALVRVPAPAAETLRWVIGPPLRSSFASVGVPASEIEIALRHYRNFYEAGAMFDAPLYPGIQDALAQIKRAGVKMYVATSKPHPYARSILAQAGLALMFERVHGAEFDGRNDDKGDLVAHILAVEGLDGARGVLIGDRIFDVKAAKRHNIRSIGVLWGYGEAEELRQAGADFLCASPAELPGLILAG